MAKILVVDDSESVRVQLRRDLEEKGHEVVEAQDGEKGVAAAQAHSDLDLILMDVNMPVLNGLQALEKMRDLGVAEQIPVFMLTTETGPEIKQKGKSLGVKAWVTKPYKADVLDAAIRKIVGS